MSDVRFIDTLKVGAYKVVDQSIFPNIVDNVDNYVLTATGLPNTFQGESQLIFNSLNLGISTPSPTYRFELHSISDPGDITVDGLLLIKNDTTDAGIKITNEGTFQLLEFNSLPEAVEGGLAYSSSNLWLGVPS